MKKFIVGAVRLAFALALALLALGAVVWGIMTLGERISAQHDRPLAAPIYWASLGGAGTPKGPTFSLATKWQDGELSYQFHVNPYPVAFFSLGSSRYGSSGDPRVYTLVFQDKAGFKLFEHDVPFSECVSEQDSSGIRSALTAKGKFYISSKEYRSAAAWQVLSYY